VLAVAWCQQKYPSSAIGLPKYNKEDAGLGYKSRSWLLALAEEFEFLAEQVGSLYYVTNSATSGKFQQARQVSRGVSSERLGKDHLSLIADLGG